MAEERQIAIEDLIEQWLEVSDRQKELAKDKKALVKSLSHLTETKETVVSASLRNHEKKVKKGEDDVEGASEWTASFMDSL